MKRLLQRSVVVAALLVLVVGGPVAAWGDVAGEVAAVRQQKVMARARMGVQIVRLGASEKDAQVVFRYNGDVPLIPASNLKIVTTAAAVERLGADFKLRTLLVMHGQDLVLIGDGDPTLGDAEVLKRAGWGTTTTFKMWAERLREMKVAGVRDVIVDDSIFDEQFLHPRWGKHQFERFGAQVGGVNLNANCLDFYIRPNGGRGVSYTLDPQTEYARVRNACVAGRRNAISIAREAGGNEMTLGGEAPPGGSGPVRATIHDPSMFAATALAETMRASGVQVAGGVKRDRTLRARYLAGRADAQEAGQWTVVGVLETRLSTVITWANKESINLYAEAICKRLGAEVSRSSGSWANGTAAVAEHLRRLGISDSAFKLDDGSGLSRENLITASAMTRVLVHAYHGRDGQAFLNSLAVGGVDGTLDNRFGGDMRGRVFGKSGFIAGVSALSGYLKARDGQWYAFSILINGIPDFSNSSIKPLQERIVRAVDREG